MESYVVGFLASDNDDILLVKKSSSRGPRCVRGKWNGLGGKIQQDEPIADAMRRTFFEECGLDVEDWDLIKVEGDETYTLFVFVAKKEQAAVAKGNQRKDEEVRAMNISELCNKEHYEVAPGVFYYAQRATEESKQ